jgi:selT/selW/selH-like putative selenoprotein
MAEELQEAFGVKANIIPILGRKGIFDVIVDGKLVFSKYETGRLPQQGEVAGKLKQ